MPRPCGAALRRLRADKAEAALLPPAGELPSQGAARARARGLVWPGDTGHTRRTALLPAARRRSLPLHVGDDPRQQGRGCGRHQACSGCCGGGEWPQVARAAHRQRRRVHGGRVHGVQPAAERRRRAAQPDGCGDGPGPPQAEGVAGCLLGRGGGDGRLHPQPLAHQGTRRVDGMTPYEAWHGRKPAVSHLRVFGCLAFAKELGHIGKLDDRSTPGVFIGYAAGSKAYRILDPETQRVRTARDVVFDEGRGWAWDKAVDDGSAPKYDDFTVEYVHFEGAGGVGSSPSPRVPTPVPEPPPTSAPATPAAPRPLATTPAAPSSSAAPPQPATPRTPVPI